MDKKNNNPSTPENDAWLDDLLKKIDEDTDFSLEEGLSSDNITPGDQLDLDSILSENWDTAPIPQETISEESDAEEWGDEDPIPQYTDNVDDPQSYYGDDTGYSTEDDMFETDLPSENAPVKKGRPKGKKGSGLLGIPHILSTLVWLALIVVIGVSLGRTIWVCTADLMAFGKEDQEVIITITDDDDLNSVAKKLAKANLIRYPSLFKTFAEVTGKDERISVGTFTLNSRLDYNAMINAMGSHAPAREEVEITFPEGYNCAQMFKLLEEKGVCTAEKLEQYAANGELDDYWFLEDVPRGSRYCLEGYLAPDTYKFYTNDEPEHVLEKLLDEFGHRFTEALLEDLGALQERYAKKLSANGYSSEFINEHPITLHSVITLASMIERETSGQEGEGYDIASVFFNRLTDPTDYPYLDSDATVYYAIGDYMSEKGELSSADLAFESPYNTRNSKGLPPGPICNPSIQSIYAALDPHDTKYYYFIFSPKDEKHLFSATYEEHQKKAAELEG